MVYFLIAILGFVAGGACVFIALLHRAKVVSATAAGQKNRQVTLDNLAKELAAREEAVKKSMAKAATYSELENENAILKTDLRNLYVLTKKRDLDAAQLGTVQKGLDQKINQVGNSYLDQTVDWVASSINATNYEACKKRLVRVISQVREMGLAISAEREEELINNLKEKFKLAVRAQLEREEQARIKARIREEQQREREVAKVMDQLERERAAVEEALRQALARAEGRHSEEIARLQQRLAEAEAAKQRAVSQAQLTKSGNVYVISNIGSFGDSVYKIGMTRRLEPMQRITELGDASVPFPFDVHMMISCDDAPTLECALHKALHHNRLNKVNPRKEFFRTSIDEIVRLVEQNHGEVTYVADPDALQYRQSLEISPEDEDFIEQVYEELDDDEVVVD